ncbi:MAG: hypothetical protein GY871_08470, partial [Actinomycetales bacterium]|nr:hypothetical protein [Actinomycetales bacterium]
SSSNGIAAAAAGSAAPVPSGKKATKKGNLRGRPSALQGKKARPTGTKSPDCGDVAVNVPPISIPALTHLTLGDRELALL